MKELFFLCLLRISRADFIPGDPLQKGSCSGFCSKYNNKYYKNFL